MTKTNDMDMFKYMQICLGYMYFLKLKKNNTEELKY